MITAIKMLTRLAEPAASPLGEQSYAGVFNHCNSRIVAFCNSSFIRR